MLVPLERLSLVQRARFAHPRRRELAALTLKTLRVTRRFAPGNDGRFAPVFKEAAG